MSEIYLAIELLEQGHREAAVRELEKILSEDIDDIAAWRLLAQAVNDPAEKQECYENVLRLDPSDQEAIDALSGMHTGQPAEGGVLPFFDEDIADFTSSQVVQESPSFLQAIESGSSANAPDEPDILTIEVSKAAEAFLFDEEEQPESKPRGLFENDAIFYSIIVVLVVVVTVLVLLLTNGNILQWIQSILPFN